MLSKLSGISFNVWVVAGALLGIASGISQVGFLLEAAGLVAELFIRLLKLVSLPLIFLSVITAITGMESFEEFKTLGSKVLKYTLLTTVIAATVALGLFVGINPVAGQLEGAKPPEFEGDQGGYLSYLLAIIPENIIAPFYDNHVLGVLFLALALALAILSMTEKQRRPLHELFSGFFAAVMTVTAFLMRLMPFGVWSFVTLFMRDLQEGMPMKGIMLYLLCVVLSNVIQAAIVLPLLLRWKGYSPLNMARGMMPALIVAFFSKSSGVALPMAMKCAEEGLQIQKRVSRFSFPLCVTINMNACAAFILTTVLFVSMSHGVMYSPLELIAWIFIATLAAVGNAGVPMGCYFLSTAFLVSMNVPLNIMGAIFPLYTVIDMLETAINVWSNGCVAAAVDADVRAEEEGSQEAVALGATAS
jgi:Na+/H+-dicarboxylate symporter